MASTAKIVRGLRFFSFSSLPPPPFPVVPCDNNMRSVDRRRRTPGSSGAGGSSLGFPSPLLLSMDDYVCVCVRRGRGGEAECGEYKREESVERAPQPSASNEKQ